MVHVTFSRCKHASKRLMFGRCHIIIIIYIKWVYIRRILDILFNVYGVLDLGKQIYKVLAHIAAFTLVSQRFAFP